MVRPLGEGPSRRAWSSARPRWPTAHLQSGPPDAAQLDLRDANLVEADLEGADLRDADLRHAQLEGAHLFEAQLRGARLQAADLRCSDLRGADLRNADLRGADLRFADLLGAELEGADLQDCDFLGCRLAGARGLGDADPGAASAPAIERGRAEALGQAIEAARRAHREGRLGLAERRLRHALRLEPDEAVARWLLALVALERGAPRDALAELDAALQQTPGATRLALGAVALELGLRDVDGALARLRALVASLAGLEALDRHGEGQGGASAIAQAALNALAGPDPDPAAGLRALSVGPLADDPLLRFALRAPQARQAAAARRADDTASRLDDATWIADETEAIAALLRPRGEQAADAATLQGALARALTIGAMDVAAAAAQRLSRILPEAGLWTLQLRELDLTAEAIHALVRTRRGRLGAVRALRWLALGAHGPTARVETERGVYFAKRLYGATRPRASIAFTHRVTRAMHDAGLRVPLPLGDAEGEEVLSFGDDALVLYDRVPGISIAEDDLDGAEAQRVGQLLAQIHLASAGIADERGRPPAGLHAGTRLLRARHPGAAWHATVAAVPAAARWLEDCGLGPAIEGRLGAIGRRLGPEAHFLPRGWIHGDLGPGNVLVTDDGAAAAIDWDLCDSDLFVFDLARTLDRCCIHWPARDPVEVRGEVARALIAGYEALRPLRDAERSQLAPLIAASRVDLDAGLLALIAGHDADAAQLIAERALVRLDRAVAGAPEIAAELWR